MLRFLTASCFGLLLFGCERPESGGRESGRADAAGAAPRRKAAERKRPADPLVGLRDRLAEADRIASPEEREKTIAGVAWDAIELDHEVAHEAFMRLPADSPEKIRLIQHYAMSLAESDMDEALEWAAALGTDGEIAAANARIAVTLAETDPYRAASLLSDSGVAGRELDVAVVQVIQRWAAQSAPEAAAWVAAFPRGQAREAGIGVVAGRWLPEDTPAAFAWLASLQDAEVRAEAARAMEGVMLQRPIEIREAWLEHADAGIRAELEQQREQAMKDVGSNIPIPSE